MPAAARWRPRLTPPSAPFATSRPAAEDLARATTVEMLTELYRPAEKAAAIQRLMQTTNPLTGKPHSASSAEAVVETDQEYWAFRERQIGLVAQRIRAKAAYDAACYRAQLAVERVRSETTARGAV